MAIEPPELGEQLFNLSPRVRMVAGVAALVLGGVSAVVLWDLGLIWYFSAFCVLIGPALFVSGWRDQIRARRFEAELVRARDEWEDLRRDLALAKRTGQNTARLLQQRGYREFAVRRWIMRELGGT